MSEKFFVVPHFIGPVSLNGREKTDLGCEYVTAPEAIASLNARARSNVRRCMVAGWVTEEMRKNGGDAHMGFFEGWYGHVIENSRPPHRGIFTGADFAIYLLQTLKDRNVVNVPLRHVIRHPVARCTMEEARGIYSQAQELLRQHDGTVKVVSIADKCFSPARWRLQSKLDAVMGNEPRIDAEAYSIDDVLHAFNIPLSEERQQCLEASRLSRKELATELVTEGLATGLHYVSKLHSMFYHPQEGQELEVRMAHKKRPDRH